jgi:hypothetical protein
MKSALIAVGCDSYFTMKALSGAEADARAVFAALTGPGQPYAKDDSILLLSPTKAEFERALTAIGAGDIDVLTFYFAGHGGAKEGGYYFCLKDSRVERLSLTGYPLNSWLNVVKELRPRYAYLIADSCNSGGSHHDIRDLLNDPRLGHHSASTFACLAAASADQYAGEVNGAGVMTAELLKVFDGRLKVGSEQAELDLTEVGRVVGQQLHALNIEQKPVVWGLNLFGAGRLCRNPHFAQSNTTFHIPEIPSDSSLAYRIARYSDALWGEYRAAARGIDAEKVRQLVQQVSGGAEIAPADRSVFVYGLANAMVGRMESCNIPWEEAEALGVFAACLLPDIRTDTTTARIARELVLRKTRLELHLLTPTSERLVNDPRYFLNDESGMADFYYLPLRLTKFLATVANAIAVAPEFDLEPDVAGARALVNCVLSAYPLAFRAVADDQAPAAYIWASLARRLGWQAEVETVFGSLFTDFIAVRGRITRCGIKPRQACEYILGRGRDPASINLGWLANPGQLLAVLLLIACENGLDNSVDESLELIDHQRMNLYLPKDYLGFGAPVMKEGVNRTHEVGQDVWTCDDFRKLFAADWSRHASEAIFPSDFVEQSLVTCAALAYPDRVPLSLRVTPPAQS